MKEKRQGLYAERGFFAVLRMFIQNIVEGVSLTQAILRLNQMLHFVAPGSVILNILEKRVLCEDSLKC